MKFGVPWNVKGVRPDLRDSARKAARRSGMSVGEWLNRAIEEHATDNEYEHGRYDDDSGGPDHEQLNRSLERIDRRLDRLISQPPRDLPYQPAPQLYPAPIPYPVAGGYAPAIDPWPNSIEQAIAEISARQQDLDSIPARPAFVPPAAGYAPAPPQSYLPRYEGVVQRHDPIPRWPVQDLSGLENQLRRITEQIESLHRPKENEDIAALRKELAELGARLSDAAPLRAIEALENEVRKLAERVAENRNAGINSTAMSSIEQGLAEVRDGLKELRPAESLAGFETAIRNLSEQIEQMGVASRDPAFLHQLEAAITGLRGIVSHVASNESLNKLAEEMHALSMKVDNAAAANSQGSAGAISAFEQRLAALSEQIKTSTNTATLPPRIEALLKSFTERLDRGELTSGEQYALGTLEDRIVGLAAKLDSSETKLSQLSSIERGLAELLVRLEDVRGIAPAAAKEGKPAPAVENLKRDLVRTQDSLEAVHGTVDAVVDRLAMIETERREQPETAAVAPPAHNVSPAVVLPAVSPPSPSATKAPHASAPVSQPTRSGPPPAVQRVPIDPHLPPDYPLEPGSGVPRERGVSAADRIAASEAALGMPHAAGSASSGSMNFIAAARRAAQAAAPEDGKPASTKGQKADKEKKSLGQKMRSLIAGAGVILAVAGGLHVTINMLDPDNRATAEAPAPAANRQVAVIADDEEPRQAQPLDAPAPKFDKNPFALPTPVLTPAPVESATALPEPEVTGSIDRRVPPPSTSDRSAVIDIAIPEPAMKPSEKFPAPLRTAAASGDMAAYFEIGMRYIEGTGVPQNLEEGARWLARPARAGLAPALFRLGSLYEKGQGVAKSLETAHRLYKASAERGNAKAMHNLAVLHAEGFQGKPNYKTAALWFRKAADRGVADSQYNLGILFARGIGVEQNLAESFKWFSLSANQGDKEAAKKRDDVAERLEPQALVAARLAVQTFAVVPQPAEATHVRGPEGGWDKASTAAPKPPKKPRNIAPMRITPS